MAQFAAITPNINLTESRSLLGLFYGGLPVNYHIARCGRQTVAFI